MERMSMPMIAAAFAVVLGLFAPAWAESTEHHPPPTLPPPAAPAPANTMTSSSRPIAAPKLAPLHTSSDLHSSSLGSALASGPSPARRALAEKLRTALHAPPSQLPAIEPAAGSTAREAKRKEEQQYIDLRLQALRASDQASLAALQQERRDAQFQVQQDYFNRLEQQRLSDLDIRSRNFNSPYYITPYYRYVTATAATHITSRAGGSLLQRAVSYGCEAGYSAGKADREDRMPPNSSASPAYRDASYGYQGALVPRNDYHYYFRKGYQRCYRAGYSGHSSLGSVLQGVLGGILHLETVR
jgi:hypothetical protein